MSDDSEPPVTSTSERKDQPDSGGGDDIPLSQAPVPSGSGAIPGNQAQPDLISPPEADSGPGRITSSVPAPGADPIPPIDGGSSFPPVSEEEHTSTITTSCPDAATDQEETIAGSARGRGDDEMRPLSVDTPTTGSPGSDYNPDPDSPVVRSSASTHSEADSGVEQVVPSVPLWARSEEARASPYIDRSGPGPEHRQATTISAPERGDRPAPFTQGASRDSYYVDAPDTEPTSQTTSDHGTSAALMSHGGFGPELTGDIERRVDQCLSEEEHSLPFSDASGAPGSRHAAGSSWEIPDQIDPHDRVRSTEEGSVYRSNGPMEEVPQERGASSLRPFLVTI